jgi:glycolate oxidase iron-sulfur subunit
MQTNLHSKIQKSGNAPIVESILRKCVHCGFCNATCPTYQLLGDELDGPRGRIYQMKQYFEGEPANDQMLKHLDRCLTCRSCETTCPSGVNYSRLLEIGRQAIEEELPRPLLARLFRTAIVRFICSGWFFSLSVGLGQAIKWMLPGKIALSVPDRQEPISRRRSSHQRKVLMLSGCVQSTLTPNTNNAAANVLNKLGIQVVELNSNQCCGAAAMHTSSAAYGSEQAKKLIDAWWPHVESGVEAIVVSATGCGVTIKDYPALFEADSDYADKAKIISNLYCDLSELITDEIHRLEPLPAQDLRVAVHIPCTMQHGLGLNHQVKNALNHVGYELCQVEDAHLCCGSAGTYSILQSELSARLRVNKQKSLAVDKPDIIATANIGCQLQISRGISTPVVHWIELMDRIPNLPGAVVADARQHQAQQT